MLPAAAQAAVGNDSAPTSRYSPAFRAEGSSRKSIQRPDRPVLKRYPCRARPKDRLLGEMLDMGPVRLGGPFFRAGAAPVKWILRGFDRRHSPAMASVGSRGDGGACRGYVPRLAGAAKRRDPGPSWTRQRFSGRCRVPPVMAPLPQAAEIAPRDPMRVHATSEQRTSFDSCGGSSRTGEDPLLHRFGNDGRG